MKPITFKKEPIFMPRERQRSSARLVGLIEKLYMPDNERI